MNTRARAPKPARSSPTPARSRRPFFNKHGGLEVPTLRPSSLQRNVVTGRPGDAYEREADTVADAVTGRRAVTVQSQTGLYDGISPFVQRQAENAQVEKEDEREPVQAQMELEEEDTPVQAQVEEEEEEAPVQAQMEQEEEEPVQARAELDEEQAVQTQAEGAAAAASPESVRDQLRARRGHGRPLPDGVRNTMEAHFGADFSGIRIHTDDPAIQMTRQLRATAFTQGRDIYFNRGRFAPATRDGDHLLAHELTHTIQQGVARARPLQPRLEPGAIQRQEDGEQGAILVRPELLQAIKLARGEIGKVDAKKTNADGTRSGWERLYEYFLAAFGQKEVVHQDVIKFIKMVKDQHGKDTDVMPSWCGIFVWWAYKSAGIPVPDWKLGASILGSVTPRPPGELPREGDIAYRERNQHFAMVTGIEGATGKDFENVRVATINGNTSGEDTLGGQVEEKWEPIGRWLAFFDPLAKLDMPPAALVAPEIEPDAIEAAATQAEAQAAVPAPVEDTAPTDVSDLGEAVTSEEEAPVVGEADVPIDIPEPAPVQPEAEVELPAAPAVPGPEPIAIVEPLPLEGPSDKAMVSFVEASPSQMAATAPSLAPALDSKLHEEQRAEVENAPVLVARTTGVSAGEGLTPAHQIPVPAETPAVVTEPEPGELVAQPHENVGEVPANEMLDEEIEDEDDGGFFGWLRRAFPGLLTRIRTTDPGVNTSAGPRPKVNVSGDAHPNRMHRERAAEKSKLIATRNATAEEFRNHPGQQNIQPRAVEEEKPSQLSTEVSAKVEAPADPGVTDYAEARLPAEVRVKADELLGPELHNDLAPAKTQAKQAADQRDTDKAAEIANAERETAQLNRDADAEQRDIVLKSRGEVARQQTLGIEDAYGAVNEFDKNADLEQTAARGEIAKHVTLSEGDAARQMDAAEADAQREKTAGEIEAAKKKKELEKAEEDQSWWDRAISAVKSAVRAIGNAIKSVFNKIRAAVKKIIDTVKNAVVGLINAARDWIVDKLNKFRDWAKEQVTKYLGDTFPGLAKRINAAIDSAVDGAIAGVNFVADTAIAAVEKLANALAKALDKVLQVFQTALTAAVGIAGAIITGDFAEALRIAIQAVCDIAGIDSQPIFDFIDRAADRIITILKDPGTFFNNLMSSVGGGVRNFAKNIKKHLIGGLVGWLTGALSEVAITIPDPFDAKGVFSLAMQILGLTYENIKAKVIRRFPPAATVFDVIQKRFTLLTRLLADGPIALWEEAKQALASLEGIVLRAIRTYVITTVVTEAMVWLLSLLNPASALVKLIKLIFDLVKFLIERFQQIKAFVVSIYDSLSAIASGALDAATEAVENALGRSLPVVISLLATLAGLGGIGKTVKSIISQVSTPVNRVVDSIVARIIAFARKLVAKGKVVAGKVKAKVLEIIQWWKQSVPFKSRDGGTHKVYYKDAGAQAQLMIASDGGDRVDAFLAKKLAEADDAGQQKAIKAAQTAFGKVRASEDRLKKLELRKNQATTDPAKEKVNAALKKENGTLRGTLLAFSRTLSAVDLADTTNLLIKTNVVPSSGRKASTVEANPLTYLPGNTVGTPPKENPPGWSHAVKIDTDPVTHARRSLWVRGHLLNENLHGPGEAWNLVPISQKLNSEMKNGPERQAKTAVATKGNVISYRTAVTFHGGKAPVTHFPDEILVTWGFLKRAPGSSPPTFTAKGSKKSFRFIQAAPPARAADVKYDINRIGRDTLVELTGISHRFGLLIKEEMDKRGAFSSYKNFSERMTQYQKKKVKDVAVFSAHMQAVKAAQTAGTLVFG